MFLRLRSARLFLCLVTVLLAPAIGQAQQGDGDRRAERRDRPDFYAMMATI